MIKLVASDLDDTLLNEEWKISQGNIRAIQSAVERGVTVTLATGRMALSSRKYARELGLDVPIITYHGALVEQGLSGEVLYRKVISTDLAGDILTELFKRNLHTQIFIKDRVFVQKYNEYAKAYSTMAGVQVEEADLFQLVEREPEGLEKILCIGETDTLKRNSDELKEIYQDRLHFTSSKANFFDMIHPEVNKGNALCALANQMGIRTEEVMAIGDSINDIEMITYAGIGVAVENAHPEVKKVADYITCSNREDGVAKAIERFVLHERKGLKGV